MKKQKHSLLCICIAFLTVFVLMLNTAIIPSVPQAKADSANAVCESNGNTYTLFTSGLTGSRQYYSSSRNKDETTINNGGYDLYAEAGGYENETIRLGLDFTVTQAITEKVELSIRAYDTDEESGERDGIYLYDVTTGSETRITHLSGWNETWNTTTIEIDPSLFSVGHTYYFKLKQEVSGWVVWVRNVTMLINGWEDPDVEKLETDIDASIDVYGLIDVDLHTWGINENYNLELKVTETATGYQRANLQDNIDVTVAGEYHDYTLQLASSAPEGIYRIDAIFTDDGGNVVKTVTIYRGFPFSAVSYNANGGSNNLPVDLNRYTEGDTVTVLFDYLPSRPGYVFLGWSFNKNATAPQFVEGDTFTIGADDETLYAVWGEDTSAAKLVIDSLEAVRGDEITVNFVLENAPAVKSFALTDFVYDSDVFILTDAEILVDGMLTDWNATLGEAVYADDTNNIMNNTAVFCLTFTIADDAPEGLYTIDCSAIFKTKPGVGLEAQFPVTVVAGDIYVSAVRKADYNDDGYIDSDDAIYLLKNTLDPDIYVLNQDGDMDGNGVVNEDDAIYLLKHTLMPDRYPLKNNQPGPVIPPTTVPPTDPPTDPPTEPPTEPPVSTGPAVTMYTDWVIDEYNSIAVDLYFENCLDLKYWNFEINFDADVFDYDTKEGGVDAEQVKNNLNSTMNSFTDELNPSIDGVLSYGGYFKDTLWTAEDFLAASARGKTCIVNDENFHVVRIYLAVEDRNAFDWDYNEITLSGTLTFRNADGSDLKTEVTDSLSKGYYEEYPTEYPTTGGRNIVKTEWVDNCDGVGGYVCYWYNDGTFDTEMYEARPDWI